MEIYENEFKSEKNFDLLGIEFDACRIEQMVDLIDNWDVTDSSAHVSFIGVPIVNLCQEDSDYLKLYQQTTITSVDGQPIVNLANKIGIESQRCSGPDVMSLILERSVKKNEKHFFYGTTDEVLKKLTNNLKERFSGIEIVGWYAPPFRDLTEEEDDEIIASIIDSGADYVWVGLGAPKQDLWINRHLARIPHVKFMAVGAAFDFYAGTLKRAPKWIRKIGLEWMYRFFKEPRRLWRRYIVGGFEWKRNRKKFMKEFHQRNSKKLN